MIVINSLETVFNIDSKHWVSELKFKSEWNAQGQNGYTKTGLSPNQDPLEWNQYPRINEMP